MKKVFLPTLLLAITLTSCQKQPETTAIEEQDRLPIAQINASEEKIIYFFNQLENPNTPIAVRKQILCKDFPDVYHKEYSLALLKVAPEYTSEELGNDFLKVANYYKVKDKLTC